MKKTLVFLPVFIIAVFTLNSCSSNKAKVNPNPTTPAATVSIENFAFSPATVTIKAGQSVMWTNKDSAPHTATELSSLFDSGSLATNQSFSFIFHTAGTYTYHCLIHSMMANATVVVTN